ncbi:EAL domain-containing protein [Pseudalkalibacillus hwajinpoensis]|uniref:EAL domain-containing protein n=1 Tax=Guptibacillus hwajinpoensis TaxID=208199 RepID=UPI00325AB3A2
MDSATRIASIRLSAEHLPKGIKRFINFLPSSIYDPAHSLRTTFQAVEQYDVDPSDLVFEVVETEKIEEVEHLKTIFQTYKQGGMKVALDDVGAGYASQEMLIQLKPDYAKIDRSAISFCDQDAKKQKNLFDLVDLAREEGITLLAEGDRATRKGGFL